MADTVVVDASAMVDALLGTGAAASVRSSLEGRSLVAPAHFDVEVMSAIGRLHRAGELTEQAARQRVDRLADAPIERIQVAPFLGAAWEHRNDTRLADGLYIAIAVELDTVVLTTDQRLARTHPDLTEVPAGSGD